MMTGCSVSPRNAAERKARDEARYRHFGPEIKKNLDKERRKTERLTAELARLREECERLEAVLADPLALLERLAQATGRKAIIAAEGEAMITDFEYRPQRWGIGWVMGLSWTYDGKPVKAILLAKNGRHYAKPKPPDDPLVPWLMDQFRMKKAAARLMARKLPKGTEEERVKAACRLYEKGTEG